MKRTLSTADILRAFNVDLATGILTWTSPPEGHEWRRGTVAGCDVFGGRNKRYWVIGLAHAVYKRSLLVFIVAHGHPPAGVIDHRDGDSLNDAASNLRDVTRLQNAWNRKVTSKAGDLPMGVKQIPSGKYIARIQVDRKSIYLGTFLDPAAAVSAYRAARNAHFGEFA